MADAFRAALPSKRTEYAILAALAGVFGLIFFVPAGPWWAVDFQGILLPYQEYLRHSLFAGELPLWNPYASLGRPFLADPQTAALWPGTLAYVVLGAKGGAYVLTVLHAWLAARATAGIAVRFGAQTWAGWGAGLCFVLNAKLLGHLHAGHVQYVIACYLLPLVVRAFLDLHEAASARHVARFALVVAWQLLAGAPQIFWCTAVFTALLGAGLWASRPTLPGLRQLGRDALAVAAGYAWALLLAAALLLPLYELIGQSNRGAATAALSAVGPLQGTDWPSLFTIFSEPGRLKDYETMPYPGLLAAVLGLAGLLQLGHARARLLLLVAAAVTLLAIAPGTFLHDRLFDLLPGYGSFRIHARWGFALGWVLALGAALFVSGAGGIATRRAAWLGATGLGLGTLLLLHPSPLFDAGQAGADWTLLPVGLLVCASLAGGLLLRPSPQAHRAGRLVAIVTLVAELGMVLLFYKGGYPRSLARPWDAAIAELAAARQTAGRTPPPRAYFPRRIAWENAGMQLGYSSLFGYESLGLIRARSVAHWSMGVEPPDNTDFPAFAALDARLPWPVAGVGLELGYDPATQTLAQRPAPDLPRAWLVPAVEVVADWREAGRRVAAGADIQSRALIEQPLATPLPGGTAPAGTVSFTGFTRNRVTLEVVAEQPTLLVLAEPWYPGWSVRLNGGQAAPALPANGWMRAVAVPAGTNKVEFAFRSRWLPLGVGVSVLALIAAWWFARRPLPTGLRNGTT